MNPISFLIEPGTSSEALAMRRKLALQALQAGSDYSPIQHWTQGLGRIAQGAMGGWEMRQIEDAEREQKSAAGKLIEEAIASLDPAAAASSTGGVAAAPSMGARSGGLVPASPAPAAVAPAPRLGRPYNPTTEANAFARDVIKSEEGYAPKAAWDVRQNSGGYGSRAAAGEQFTPDKAEQYLQRDMAPVTAWIDKNAPNANINQRAALASFGYNLGTDDLDKLKPDIQRGDWGRVGERMQSFNNAATGPGGSMQPLDGLTSRRRRERRLLLSQGGEGGSPPSAGGGGGGADGGSRPPSRLAVASRLLASGDERAQKLGTAFLTAELSKEKEKPQVVAPGGSLVDSSGNVLYQAPQENEMLKAEQREMGKSRAEARQALPDAQSTAQESLGVIDKLRNHQGLDQGTGWTSLLMSRVPGTQAYAFEQLRRQAQGTAFLTAIGKMRGTGAISNVEGEAATAAVARMASAQSKDDFLDAMNDYEGVVRKGLANSYTRAGLEVPEGVMQRRQAPAAAAAEQRQARPIADAPPELQEGQRLRDSEGNIVTVRGGKLVPIAGGPARTAPEPSGSPRTAGSAGGTSAAPPTFKGPWTQDRRALMQNPTPEVKAAFDARYGKGKADQVLQRDLEQNQPITTRPGRYGYRAGVY